MPTTDRPRLQPETDELLSEIVRELKYMKKEENQDVSKYEGRTSQVAKDRVIREGLKALNERGYDL